MDGNKEFEAIVIGSGFGGAVAALRLGEAGIPTLVLERGRQWVPDETGATFATYARPDGRAAWLRPRTVGPVNPGVPIEISTGILDQQDGEGITTLTGVGVGGGSLVFTGALVQPTREGFARVLPHLDYERFARVYYPRVRAIIRPAPLPQDVLADPHFELMRAFLQLAEQAHIPTARLDMAFDWEVVRQEMRGEREAHLLSGLELWYGINAPIKLSLDRNYLLQAQATGQVEVRPLHEVTLIEAIGEQDYERYRVSGCRRTLDGKGEERFTFVCRTLIVAAGSVGTSELFVRAKALGALPRLNNEVGSGWGNNGDVLGIHPSVKARTAVPQLPGGIAAFLPDLPQGPVTLFADAAANQLVTLAITLPAHSPQGRFVYDPTSARVLLRWPDVDQQHAAARQASARLLAGSDMAEVPASSVLTANLATHPLGGMLLGKACDLSGCVIGYKRLYVLDGALLPGSAGGVNPALTIAALAEFLVETLIQDTSYSIHVQK